jgi:hypothetical protein
VFLLWFILIFINFANENDNANEISYMLKTSNMKKNLNYEMSLDVQYEILFIITPYIRMLDSDWLIAVIFFYKFRPCIVNLQNFYFMWVYLHKNHVWEGYLRKIPIERRKISRAKWRRKFSLKTGIFRK